MVKGYGSLFGVRILVRGLRGVGRVWGFGFRVRG